MPCRVCESDTVPFAEATVLGRHKAAFVRCSRCGAVAVQHPHWLEEAYSTTITASDLGLVDRNLQLSRITRGLISLFFAPGARFLDYAGGYGLLVRLMRDAGYDFYWHDPYCSNLFAGPLILSVAGDGKFELLTAFEMLEHLEQPLQVVEQMLTLSGSILFTTLLLPEAAPKPADWWYYGLEHGQHLTFYTRRSLEILAERFGRRFYTNGSNLHLITDKRLPSPLFWLFARRKGAFFLAPFCRRRSLLPQDMHAAGLEI